MIKKNNTILILLVILLINIFRYNNEYYCPLDAQSLTYTLLFVFLAVCASFIQFRKDPILRGNYLNIFIVFVLGYVIVHFFRYLGYVTGVYQDIIDLQYIDSKYVNGAAICSCSSLISFFIGYAYENNGFSSNSKHPHVIHINRVVPIMYILLLIFIYSVGIGYFKNGSGEMMNSERGVPILGQLSPIWLLACNVVISMHIIYNKKPLSFSEYFRYFPISYYILVAVYLILVILSGDRGPLFHFGLCYMFTYIIAAKKKIGKTTVLLLLIIAVFSLSLLGTIRAMDNPFKSSTLTEAIDTRNERYNDINPLFSSTEELSNIVRSYHVIYYIGSDLSKLYGLGFINQALGIIPGLRYFLYPALGINEDMLKTSSMTTAFMGKDHGMGTSCVGDTYINLGFYGTLLFFFLFGRFIKKMDMSQITNACFIHPFYLSLILCYGLYSIYLCRSTLFTPINLSVYSYVFFVLFSTPFKK